MKDKLMAALVFAVVFGPIAYNFFREEMAKKRSRDRFLQLGKSLEDEGSAD